MSNNLTAALQYLNEGYSIMPLYSPEILGRNPPAKFTKMLKTKIVKNKADGEPLTENEVREKVINNFCKMSCLPSWREYQKRKPTEEEVTQWFTNDYPGANIGIITGKLSNLVVVDLDTQEIADDFREKGWFDKAGVVKSGRGYHLYFQYPDFEVTNAVNKELKVDIRGEGGYITAPPSVHGSGIEYKWVNRSILTQDPGESPEKILKFIKKLTPSAGNENPLESSIAHGCDDGNRHDTGIRVAGHFFGKGLNEAEVKTLMLEWNKKNNPPLPDQDIFQMVTNIATHEKEKTLADHKKEKSPAIDIESLLWSSERIATGSENGLRTPFAGDNFKSLQKNLNGGFVGGCIYLLGGVPSSGKTALVNCLADNICLQEHPVLFFSYDDAPTELNNRTLARFSGYQMETINQQNIEKADIISTFESSAALQKIIQNKYMADEVYQIELWPKLIEQIIKKHDKPPVIFIDYLKRLSTRKKAADERMRIDEIIKQLDKIAKKYNLPVFAISELNRESYRAGQNIGMASFKESGGLEYSASWLGILASIEEKNDEYKLIQNWKNAISGSGNIDLLILKSKRGTGNTGRIPLTVNTNKMLVVER